MSDEHQTGDHQHDWESIPWAVEVESLIHDLPREKYMAVQCAQCDSHFRIRRERSLGTCPNCGQRHAYSALQRNEVRYD